MIIIHTNLGQIKIKLANDKTPRTVENFLSYARDGFYDNTIFHRVVKNFVVQGGGFTADMSQKKTKDPIENEAKSGLSNKTGTIAMARTMAPHSATSQFFINVNDNVFLDHTSESRDGWGYCAFGEVTEGMDIVQSMNQVSTQQKMGHDDVPVESIVIERVEVVD